MEHSVPCLPVRYADNELKDRRRVEGLAKRRAERVERFIENPKTRLIGVDEESLAKQIEEKCSIEQKNSKEDSEAAAQLEKAGRAWDESRRTVAAQRAANALTTAKHWAQQIETAPLRTTAALNDPKALAKAAPIRSGIVDPRLGASSAQIFTGEDHGLKDRVKAQAAALRERLAGQEVEKATAAVRRKQEEL